MLHRPGDRLRPSKDHTDDFNELQRIREYEDTQNTSHPPSQIGVKRS